MALDPIVIGSYSCNISSPSAFYHDLELIVGQWCKSAHMIDPLTSIEEVIELFPLSALENAIRTHEVSYQDVISTAKASINQANYYLKWTQKSPISVGFWTPFYEAFITFLETLLNIFGIADIFEPSDSTFDANSKFQKVMMLLSFTCLTTGLVPILGLATSSLIVGGLLLTLVLLSLIYPKIRPLPFSLPHATNWTKQIQEGVFTETYDRRSVVSEIAECLISSEKIKKHPMLIGKTRVGKTQAAMAFAIAVERGDYPSLKDKVVYYVNAADLISAGDPFGNKVKTLSSLKKGIGQG